jgi:hypothetical protein
VFQWHNNLASGLHAAEELAGSRALRIGSGVWMTPAAPETFGMI